MFATAEVTGWPAVVAAAIGTAGTVLCAVLAFLGNKRAKVAAESVKPNGQGTVVQMQERTLMEIGRLHERMDGLEEVAQAMETRLTALEQKHP